MSAHQHSALSSEERGQGFVLLLENGSLSAFRGYRMESAPNGWSADGNELSFDPKSGSADLSTREKYGDFDLRFDFKIAKGGNSGVKILVAEEDSEGWPIGPEYQIIDDDMNREAPYHRTGACYEMYAPSKDSHKPAGEWNSARILKQGAHVTHWLNGEKVVEYEIRSDDWTARLKKSKYTQNPSYARDSEGYICFQDHGTKAWFRNLRIRKIN